MSGERGIALILVILITTFLSALGFGLLLAVFMDRLATGNMAGSVAMLYAADAGVELAAHELAQAGSIDDVLAGIASSNFTDGSAGGVRRIPSGGEVDLTAITNALNCGKTSSCSGPQMNANGTERPWGTNNPRWQLFAYGAMAQFTALARPAPCYLAVWIGDDPREQDGNPLVDEVDPASPGHGIVRVHAEAFGPAGARRAIEAELSRVCLTGSDAECLPGIRVQSWQELRQGIP
jgi:hypothetical protein